jgi:hypothetical protein
LELRNGGERLALAAMRSITCSLFLLFGLAVSVTAQTARPQFRPAVLGAGKDSLINRIDVKDLLAKGQKNGAVQFAVVVQSDGDSAEAWTYRAMPDCQALEKEVLQRLAGAKFTAPLYNHQPVRVILYGTVIFNPDDVPHLRIFLNQDPERLRKGADFIGPQPVIGADSDFTGLHMPPEIPVAIEGVVELKIHVDEKGSLHEINVTGEDPPLLGFRQSVEKDFEGAKFIPPFLDGDAVDTVTILSVCYKPVGVQPGAEQ